MTKPADRPADGQIVTFYSYKGGTGRTMALANIAWILASNGFRVLAVDWDLESPGLHRYLHPFLRDRDLRNTDGVIDMIRRYSDAIMSADDEFDLDDLTDLDHYVTSIEWDFGSGILDFIGAGRQEPQYSTIVSTFDWDSFWNNQRGGTFFQLLRNQMRDRYDYVLLDSRTGLSDTAGICTVQIPDTVVACFTLNTQSIEGSAAVASSIVRMRQQRGAPVPRILPVPTRVEDGELRRLDRGRSYAHRSFAPFVGAPGTPSVDTYWGSVELPYRAYYAYEEMLATFGDPPHQENSLLAPYVRLAGQIAGRPVAPPSIDEKVRQRVLHMFERSDPIEPSNILINYVPLDRVYAEWLCQQLVHAGHRAVLHFAGAPAPDLDQFDRVIALVSRDYPTFPENEQFTRNCAAREPGDSGAFVVPVQIGGTPLPVMLSRYPGVDLAQVGPERALDVILAAARLTPVTTHAALDNPDLIRYPRVEVPYWNLLLVRNAAFSGRHRLLESLRDHLLSDSANGGRVALEGINGVGKTQIALEYAYRFAATYDVVWWISAEQTDRVRTSLVDLAERFGIAGDAEERVKAVRERLRMGKPSARWLIVLDNADAPEELHDFLPGGAGHILITTRNPHWTEKFHVPRLDVGVFAHGESVELLQRRVPGLSRDDAGRIAESLGNLPLALEQAAAWLALTGMPAQTYLDELAARTATLLDQQAPPNQLSTTATVRVSFERLRGENPAAARLMELFAFMAPEAIPFRLVAGERLSEYLTEIDPTMHDSLLQGTLISAIGRYALARVNTATGGAVVHRLTQGIIRDDLGPEAQDAVRTRLWRILADAHRGKPEDRDSWPRFEELRAHLEASGATEAAPPDVRQLLIQLVQYLRHRSDFGGAQDLADRIQSHWTRLFGENDLLTLRLRFEQGNIARARGHAKTAYDIDVDTVHRLTDTVGEHHPYTMMASAGLAASLRALGEFFQARDLDEQTVALMREALSPNHERTLSEVNNHAVSLRLTGDVVGALNLDRDNYLRAKRVLASGDHRRVIFESNYGRDLREVGQLRESHELLRDLLEQQSKVAKENSLTWQVATNLAVTLRLLGQTTQAHAVAQRAFDELAGLVGTQHAFTVAAELEMACALWHLGQTRTARQHANRVYAYHRDRSGPNHPFTLIAATDLAMMERADGEQVRSRSRAEEAAAQLTAVFGPQHPYVLVAEMSAATGRYDAGTYDEAHQRDQQVYARLRELLGEPHPTVVAAGVNLALSDDQARLGPRQRSALDMALDRCAEVFGDSHPYTLAARSGRRIDLDIELQPT